MKKRLIIFDLDGTLYSFDNSSSVNFTSSKFYDNIKRKVYVFLSKKLGIDGEKAKRLYEEIKKEFNGEVSLGLEDKLKIDRYEFFRKTWNLDPSQFIEQKDMLPLIKSLKGTPAFLTSAPRVWASRVLKYLNLNEYQDRLFTGEPNLRKPNPLVFKQICDSLGFSPLESISVGDQVSTDIIPAKSLGMKTILVRSSSSEADVCIESLAQINEAVRRLK